MQRRKRMKENMKLLRNAKTLGLYTHGFYKKEKGITLIALVVTIVVLLILAGVSINLVLGQNGLINKAKDAQNRTIEARDNEEKDMSGISDWIDQTLQDNGNGGKRFR